MWLLLMAASLMAGRLFHWPRRVVWTLIGVLWLMGLGMAVAAGDPRGWLLIGGVLALVLGYRAVLVRLHRKAAPTIPAPTIPEAEIDRYARHIILRELGGPGQAALKRARALVVGAGGLGAPVLLYLAAAGVGRITVADDDRVSLSNLQRQVIFATRDEGRPKAQAARDAMLALNPHVAVTALERRIGADDVDLIAAHDLVIDGTDTFAARQAVNAACTAAGVPLIAGAIAQWEGQLTIWDPARDAPCMACLFPDAPAAGLAPSCAEAGVVGPLPGVLGSMMALEAIKLIAGTGTPLRGQMLIFDGLYGESRSVKIRRRVDCPVCGSGHSRLG
ncbi:molybdopterin-synthase adenylyltransferase MoeB [Paracoccus sp. DK608]|uniref:Molybdopterin-synthase adenylyltransferase n=1 Tax=Paracoccus shanxieyensis TaxID=2675752 RepID=A0A6L6IZG0_9RHOB|nr:molybdopterin-synthase adenylyltransferase MoeB [Paracoccus shanxieyensis]MTH88105.1 molybdopterin-synthase adenylyltransferase MoeB [Paracoccus shanxieyensis]